MTNHTSRLQERGFELAGDLTLDIGNYTKPSQFIKASLESLTDIKDHMDVVYVYVVDGVIVYVGETGENFSTRFKRHINGVMSTSKEPIPSRLRWRELLGSNGVAQIYIHKCQTSDYFGEQVSLRGGFESALISKFDPALNSPREAQKRKMIK